MGTSYELPLIDESPWLVQAGAVDVFVGSLNTVSLLSPWIKITFFADAYGVNFTFLNAAFKFNTVDWSYCSFMDWFFEIAKVEIYAEVDVNECAFGIASYFDKQGSALQCAWQEYHIEDPLFQTETKYHRSGDYLANTCREIDEDFTLIEPEEEEDSYDGTVIVDEEDNFDE